MKVIGLGQCAYDYLFVTDSFPVPDTKKEILEWTNAGGGPVATALAGLARLGIECRYHGIIGGDEAGKRIRESLLAEKINIDGLIERPGSDSQVAFIAVEKVTGKRTIFWKRPSAKPLHPDELPDNFLEGANFLLVDGLMAKTSIYAAKEARKKGIPVMLDAGRVREGMIDLANLSDYIVASEEFARGLRKDKPFDPEEAIEKIRSFGAKAATITLGDKGSITLYNDDIFRTPAFKVDAVDTTGAGDVFHGGYIYGILQKWDIKEVVRFASAFAAIKCRKLGGRAGIPGLKETMEFMKERS